MRKYKKIITLFISLLTMSGICFNVSAFKYTNKDKEEFYEKEDNLKRKNIKTNSIKKQKGFVYSMNVRRPKNAPGNFIDVFNKCFMYILGKNTSYKEKENIKVSQFFKNCDYKYDNSSYNSKQYVFSDKENLKYLREFYKENMADRNFNKFCDDYNFINYKNSDNNKTFLTNNEYENFLNSYCNRLWKKFRRYLNLLKKAYEKNDLDKLEKVLNLYYKDTSHSEDVLSFMNQSKHMKILIERMLKIVEYKQNEDEESLNKKTGRNDDNFFDISSFYYDDDDDEFFGYGETFKKDYDDYDDYDDFDYNLKHIGKNNFKKCLEIYYRIGSKDIRNLRKVSFDDFKKSVRSVDFEREIKFVTRKIKEVSGTIETLEKN